MHRIDVSEFHSVLMHLDAPIRPDAVNAKIPKPAPLIVTDDDPVPARLARRMILMLGKSNEYVAVPLPKRSPIVITTRRVPLEAAPAMHLSDVSDSHSVISHRVDLLLAFAVNVNEPRPAPWTVKLVDPVPALLILRSALAT